MINSITPETLYLILPMKIGRLAVLYAEKYGISTEDALVDIYNSNTYKDLEREDTKLWHLGPVALLEHIAQYH